MYSAVDDNSAGVAKFLIRRLDAVITPVRAAPAPAYAQFSTWIVER